MTEDLLALSVLQPWLWAMLAGHKIARPGVAVENRQWRPPRRMLGARFALHSSRGLDVAGIGFVNEQLEAVGIQCGPAHARGVILATARLRGAVHLVLGAASRPSRVLERLGDVDDELAEQLLRSPWTFGPWAWALDELRPLRKPVPARGALGFWKVLPTLAAEVRRLEVAA